MASLGSTPGLIVAAGVGAAAATALEPAFEVPKQDAWARLPNRILDVGTLARLVAQGGVLLGNPDGSTAGSAYAEAYRQGYASDKLNRLIWLEQHAPDLALVLDLWRRGLFGEPTSEAAVAYVDFALGKEQIEPRYWDGIKELFVGRLDPALIATMVQRSVLPNAQDPVTGALLLPFSTADATQAVYDDWAASTRTQLGIDPPTGHNVTPMPQVNLDPIKEARAHGIDFDRLAAETRIVGLPASTDLAARMVFRGIATPADFVQAVAEGNARVEWAPALFQAFRAILTANQYAELQLRGYLTEKERRANTLKHGMSEADSDLLYDLLGRGLNVHQALIGLRRGGTFKGPINHIPDWALYMLERGNLRPEVYNLAYAAVETYPSYFVTRALLQGGVISPDRGKELFDGLGWPQDVADAASKFYGKGSAATADPHVTKAQTKAWTMAQNSYIAEESTPTDVAPIFDALNIPTAARTEIFTLWDEIRRLTRKQLSPADIRKALQEGITNPDTGNPWTRQQALDALVARGYDLSDANTYLDTPYKG